MRQIFFKYFLLFLKILVFIASLSFFLFGLIYTSKIIDQVLIPSQKKIKVERVDFKKFEKFSQRLGIKLENGL